MDRDEAIKLLKGGADGVAERNRRREAHAAVPDLRGTNLDDANLTGINLANADLALASMTGFPHEALPKTSGSAHRGRPHPNYNPNNIRLNCHGPSPEGGRSLVLTRFR